MLDLLLLIGMIAIIGTGYFIWRVGKRGGGQRLETTARRREDARDWQRRFGADSLLAANFLQPTQNEILETLSLLDHLTPGWETGGQDSSESHFLSELAVSFPSLRKPGCAFPLPFTEILTAKNISVAGRGKRPVTEEELAARRESFRASRAQSNALEQIAAGAGGSVETAPSNLPFRAPTEILVARGRNPWPVRFAAAAVLIAALLGVSYSHDRKPDLRKVSNSRVERDAPQTTVPVEPAQATPEPDSPQPVVAASPTPTPEPEAAPSPVVVSTPAPVSGPSPGKAALNAQIAASQQRAIGKYPALAVEGSEINLRFVFRYKNLVHENSPRLLEPTWPEQLAEECAAAALSSKHSALTQVTGARR